MYEWNSCKLLLHNGHTIQSKIFVALYFLQILQENLLSGKYNCEYSNLINFCGNSDHCLLAFCENLNMNILFEVFRENLIPQKFRTIWYLCAVFVIATLYNYM